MLDCNVSDCRDWVSNNTADPHAGHCRDLDVVACYKRARARFLQENVEPMEDEDGKDNPPNTP